MKKSRLPRKIKKKIPKGVYCYKGIHFDSKTGIYHVKKCDFYTNIKMGDKPIELQDEIDKEYPEEYVGWCNWLTCEIDDRCKNCGINKK
jgi:hypothetical protein